MEPEPLAGAYSSFVTPIYLYLCSRVGNRPDAEDLTSQVFVKAVRKMRTDASATELRRWFYRVAQRTLADHWRKYYAEDVVELSEETSPPPAQSNENPEALRRVECILQMLPVTYRRVLELRFLRGYSIRETALELGLSQANVRVMQFRALNRAGREPSRPTRSEREFPEQQALQEI